MAEALFVVPGKYTVALAKRVNGVVTDLPGSQTFEVVGGRPVDAGRPHGHGRVPGQARQTAEGADRHPGGRHRSRVRASIPSSAPSTPRPSLSPKLREQALGLQRDLDAINLALTGDRIWRATTRARPPRSPNTCRPPAAPTRGTTGRPTKTAMEQYQIASDELAVQIPKMRKLIETDIKNLEKQLDAAGAPPTPGRLPDWKGGK